jgi:hypothetical protein
MYKSYFMESFKNELNKAIEKIANILNEYKVSFCIIGGAARFKYHVEKMTQDIDILISKEDKNKIKKIPMGQMRDISNGRSKIFNLHDPKARIEFIYSGEISGDGIHGLKYVEPENIKKDFNKIPYISLIALIQYKLSAGIYGERLKDFADIIDLIQKNNLKKDYGKNFRKDLKIKYEELWDSIKNIKNI